MAENALLAKLRNGGNVVIAEGYIFEFERKGYLKAGSFVPEVVVEHPELVRQLHREFVHAGSDVVLAFTYYAHREKLRLIGRENELKQMNLMALKIAREVADETGTLMAGNICNTTVYETDKPDTHKETEAIFKEQIEWAVEGGADFIVAETFGHYGEAAVALSAILKYGAGLPAVVTLSAPVNNITHDGIPVVEACKKLEENGATVVGLNCGKGPETMIPVIKEIRKVCKGPIAAVPVPYRTTEKEPTFFSLKVPGTDKLAFPLNLITCLCSREQIEDFAKSCKAIGVQYVGVCCGNASHYTRIVAEVYGREPPASKYAPEMHKHFIFGDKSKFGSHYTNIVKSRVTGQESS